METQEKSLAERIVDGLKLVGYADLPTIEQVQILLESVSQDDLDPQVMALRELETVLGISEKQQSQITYTGLMRRWRMFEALCDGAAAQASLRECWAENRQLASQLPTRTDRWVLRVLGAVVIIVAVCLGRYGLPYSELRGLLAQSVYLKHDNISARTDKQIVEAVEAACDNAYLRGRASTRLEVAQSLFPVLDPEKKEWTSSDGKVRDPNAFIDHVESIATWASQANESADRCETVRDACIKEHDGVRSGAVGIIPDADWRDDGTVCKSKDVFMWCDGDTSLLDGNNASNENCGKKESDAGQCYYLRCHTKAFDAETAGLQDQYTCPGSEQ